MDVKEVMREMVKSGDLTVKTAEDEEREYVAALRIVEEELDVVDFRHREPVIRVLKIQIAGMREDRFRRRETAPCDDDVTLDRAPEGLR